MIKDIGIIVSASEVDDTIYPGQERGWITSFLRYLEMMIQSASGKSYRIEWITEKDELDLNKYSTLPIFISILSPDYIFNENLINQVNAYGKIAGKKLDEESLNSRLFKVFKAPLEEDQVPSLLINSISYEMFAFDEETGEAREVVDFFSLDGERYFWMRLVDLAYDLHEAILLASELTATDADTTLVTNSKKAIYLAETGNDLAVQRNIIKRELQRHGYKVLPNKRLPDQVEPLENSIKHDLENSMLSIHMISDSVGIVPRGTDESIMQLQNRIASEFNGERVNGSSHQSLKRLVWVAPHIRESNEAQVMLIEEIKRDSASMQTTEILQSSLEDFKNAIWTALQRDSAPKKTYLNYDNFKSKGDKVIYLIHDKVDRAEAEALADYVRSKGYMVVTPTFEGDLMDIREFHIENLKNLDAAIIFHGKVNPFWVRMKLLDLLKSPGFGRKTPILGKVIYSSRVNEVDYDYFKNFSIEIVDEVEAGERKAIDPFLEKLKKVNEPG